MKSLASLILVFSLSAKADKYTIDTEVEINAPIDQVWQVFTDFPNWEAWNPFIRAIDGDVTPGNEITETIQLIWQIPIKVKAQIVEFEPYRLVWTGHILSKEFGSGIHQFEVIALDENRTLFIQREVFEGIFVKATWPIFRKVVTTKFDNMNEGLRAYIEGDEEVLSAPLH